MKEIFRKAEEFVRENKIIEKGDKILVAVSGGPDSVFLLKFLLHLSKKFQIQLRVAYIHHHLRKEADEELEFVKQLAKKEKVPFNFRHIKIEGKTGIEEKAREKRIKSLMEIAKRYECNKIATGHTLDDHAETIMMNLIRGCGLAGLRGILPVSTVNNITIIRPILCLEKKEIENALTERKIEFKIDRTNLSMRFFRNRVRHKIIPFLSEFNPEFKKNIGRMGFVIQQDFEFLIKEAKSTLFQLIEDGFF
ncbi:tRNA lysidine(34) synthetase TilS, partial [bacterium]|nr:tRNA lysidine(34) synthetase TilS [bacterium]